MITNRQKNVILMIYDVLSPQNAILLKITTISLKMTVYNPSFLVKTLISTNVRDQCSNVTNVRTSGKASLA